MTDRLATPTDFSIHGVVNVRFVGAPDRLTRRFADQWGPCLAPPADPEPDVLVRWAELSPGPIEHIGHRWSAVSNDNFFLLDEFDGSVTTRLPIADIGEPCEIVCRPDTTAVPFLTEALSFAFLRKGYVPLHASAFEYEGVGIVAMGWPKGGKTGALLAFASRGARYVGDEWVMLSLDGGSVLGLPLPVGVSEWQLKYVRDLIPSVDPQKRLTLRGIHMAEHVDTLVTRSPFGGRGPAKLLHKSLPALRRQLKVTHSPAALFGEDLGPLAAAPDRVFLLTSHEEKGIRVEPSDGREIATRMVHANEHEWRPLLERYRAFRFAFPNRRNELFEGLSGRLEELLVTALSGTTAYRVLHPYGGPLDVLYTEMRPHCLR